MEAGTLADLARRTRIDASRISKAGNPNESEFLPIDVAMDLDALAGDDRILRAWAELRGFDLVKDERGVAVESMARHVGSVGKESGELISEMCSAIADCKVTPAEATRIEAAAEDVKDNVLRLQDDCRRIRSGER
nr:phage regulatory CII family protein [Tardiphaga sp.]